MKALYFAFLGLIGGTFIPRIESAEPFADGDSGELRIAIYNVENYALIPRRIDGKMVAEAGKPEPERRAVAKSIGEIAPDIIGIMEMGKSDQLDDLRRKLHDEGLNYAEEEYVNGPDPSRHIALLSRFPIVERHSMEDIPLRVGSVTLHSPRGLLDVTIEPIPGYRIRILCVHLKAKLEVPDYDATALREAEATFLRKRIREILSRDHSTRLVVMGDFNDTKNSHALWEITGKPDWPDSLRVLPMKDRNGESWTEYWESADVYSRIDYIMISKRLEQEIDEGNSFVARFPYWREASDHCPLVLTLKKIRNEPAAYSTPLPSK